MTAVTENDLKRLEDLIVSGQKAIESRLTNLENGEKAIEKPAKNLYFPLQSDHLAGKLCIRIEKS